MIRSITVQPVTQDWPELLRSQKCDAQCLGLTISEWRDRTHRELFGYERQFHNQWHRFSTGASGAKRSDPSSIDSCYETNSKPVQPIILTGHQAEFRHPGVYAKYLTMEAMRQAGLAGSAVELVVDQDVNDPLTVRVPAHVHRGGLVVGKVRLVDRKPSGRSVGWQKPLSAGELIDEVERTLVRESPDESESSEGLSLSDETMMAIRRMQSALVDESHRSSLAEQVACAATRLEAEHSGIEWGGRAGDELCRISVSSLVETSFWAALIDKIKREPSRVTKLYNEAVGLCGDSGINPLRSNGNRVELPLWLMSEDGQRQSAWSDDLDHYPANRFLPKALLTTGYVRLVVCDLMIHGLGGARYDRVTDYWLKRWLGVEPAPFVTVSATMVRDWDGEFCTSRQVRQAQHETRSLRFNLDRFTQDEEAIRVKSDLLQRIEKAPRRSPERRRFYVELQRVQESWCKRFRDVLEAADARVAELESRVVDERVLDERTWPVGLYPVDEMDKLRRDLFHRFENV